jgi:hypothetical protein
MDESRQSKTNSFQRTLKYLEIFSKCLKTDGLFENMHLQGWG